MASRIYGPRKRRTRQHVIADLGVHHVEGLILAEGHTAERVACDYGYDLVMTTYDSHGYIEPNQVYFQIKGSETLKSVAGAYVCDIDIRDYNLWLHEQTPVVLVLFDVARDIAVWEDIQRYFLREETRKPQRGARWVRVSIPEHHVMSRSAIASLRLRKNRGWL